MTTRPLSYPDDAGVAQLVGRLTEDSKRLVSDEIRLAKLELHEGMQAGTRGAMWLAVAFGAAVVMLTALTVLVSVLLGRAFGNLWAGTLVTGLLELVAGGLMLRHGLALFRRPPYSLPETRDSLAETGRWAKHRGHEA
ncbi:MAG TPA: phage holin family protein [Gemmatimonadaceae bacterium]|nr:phage holin family protein [Gemmatimonadaceae bacterium]